jgi:hypothetical protein
MQYNSSLYNTGEYNGGPNITPVHSTDLAVFDGFSLADGTTMICEKVIDSAATREVNEGNIPRGNGMYVNGAYWRKKPIEVKGIVKAESKTALEAALDMIRKNLRRQERDLDITRTDEDGNVISVRRYTATWINPEETFADREYYHITFCPFIVRFTCHYPFGRDRSYTETALSITSSPTNQQVYHAGTVESEPVIFMVFDVATSVTVVNVKRLDPATGVTLEEIEYSGTVAAGDVLEFDSERKRVRKNGVEVRYLGSFLTLDVGSSLLQFNINGTFSVLTTTKNRGTFL